MMKKLIVLLALAGLMAGCSHNKNSGSPGTSEGAAQGAGTTDPGISTNGTSNISTNGTSTAPGGTGTDTGDSGGQ